MLSLADARAVISNLVAPFTPNTANLSDALGLCLAEPALADEDIPSFDRSAMDGYAVNDSGSHLSFEIVGEVQTGSAPEFILAPGQCARIFTGAPVPTGSTRIVLQEHVSVAGSTIQPTQSSNQTWIRYRGEDARRGCVLLPKGTVLGPGELSILAGVGTTAPLVFPRPRVIHFTTGNELVPATVTPQTGQIRDTNSILVSALLSQTGAQLRHQQHVRDSLEALVSPITALPDQDWDLLLISGGASVGDFDFGARALEQLGFQIHFRKLNLRPGKPLIFATRGHQTAFVIPGNPISHFVTFHVAIKHALGCMIGQSSPTPLISLPLAVDLPSKPDPRETWWPARILAPQGQLTVQPIAWQSSGDIRGLHYANALIQVPPGTRSLEANTPVPCLLLEMQTPLSHP